MSKENFKDWIVFKPDWNEIGWQYNTGKRYQNKQDLIAVFWNSYIYLQQKFEAYHSKFEKVPHDYFKELIFKFRQKFPKNGRIKGINYYDDLIEQLIEKYSQPQQVQEIPPGKESDAEHTEVIKKHFNFFSRDCPRKGKQILNDDDFDKLINWTIYYYENDLKIPEINEPIKVINTNMTYVILAFRYLFKEIYPLRTFPNSLFEFFTKAFKPYSEYKKSNFDKARNDNEVRKLMKIDE